jgi:plasmid stability protein
MLGETVMAQIIVRKISKETVEQLKLRASRSHRSLEAEVRVILEDVADREQRREEFWRFAEQSRIRNGPQTTDSTELIREDRER